MCYYSDFAGRVCVRIHLRFKSVIHRVRELSKSEWLWSTSPSLLSDSNSITGAIECTTRKRFVKILTDDPHWPALLAKRVGDVGERKGRGLKRQTLPFYAIALNTRVLGPQLPFSWGNSKHIYFYMIAKGTKNAVVLKHRALWIYSRCEVVGSI